jgi:uncharacterized DUF497 family protein
MRIPFDPAKRKITLAERGLDFADAALVFAGVTIEIEDTRKHYGETRIICSTAYWKAGWLSWVTRRVARIATYSA